MTSRAKFRDMVRLMGIGSGQFGASLHLSSKHKWLDLPHARAAQRIAIELPFSAWRGGMMLERRLTSQPLWAATQVIRKRQRPPGLHKSLTR